MVKYLKRFEDHYSLSGNSYVDFSIGEDYITPSVSVCDDEYEVHYNDFNEADNWVNEAYNSEQKNLRFTATANGCKIALKRFWKKYTQAKPNGYPYGNDFATYTGQWTEVASAQTITLNYKKNDTEMGRYTCGTVINSNSGETVEFYCPYTSNYFNFINTSKKEINIYSFCTSGGAYVVDGLVTSLLVNPTYWGSVYGKHGEHIAVNPYCFFGLFMNYPGYFGGECVIRGKLVLPTLTMSEGCYAEMFLKSPISDVYLPSTNLADCCYRLMFYRCSNIKKIFLPATRLANYCYYNMFSGCRNLKIIKCLSLDEPSTGTTASWLSAASTSPAPSGVFYQNPDAEWISASTIPSANWTFEKL